MTIDQSQFRALISGERRDMSARLARPMLRVLSLPYEMVTGLRRRAYGAGLLRSRSAEVPVISVGNITTGGTGKTPVVAWLVRRLQLAGRTAGVLTRGYKAVGGVSDEAQMLRCSTGVAVVVNPDRLAGARQASLTADSQCKETRYEMAEETVWMEAPQ